MFKAIGDGRDLHLLPLDSMMRALHPSLAVCLLTSSRFLDRVISRVMTPRGTGALAIEPDFSVSLVVDGARGGAGCGR